MRRLLTAMAFGVLVVGCSIGDDDASSTTVAPFATTPRPDAAQGAAIEASVAAIYPGVPEGKAGDWARSTCKDILDGKDEPTVVGNVVQRFAGGDRPEPTPEQAAAIVALVRSSGFCVG